MNNNQTFGVIASVAFAIIIILLLQPVQSDDIFFIKEDNSGAPTPCTGNLGLVLAQNITDLCDVTVISPSTNQILEYNGTQWVNVAHATFSDSTTCNNLGSGTIICAGDNVDLKSLLEGTGIDITNSSTEITITNTLPESTVCVNQTTGHGLCINDDITLKNLLAGSSISLTSNSTHVTITNTAPDNTVCANVGTGTQVYKDGECNFRTLVGSSDISITNTSNTIVIDYNGTHVTSVTSNSNSTIGVVPTTGAVVLYPSWVKLCSNSTSGASVTCSSFTGMKFLHVEIFFMTDSGGTTVVSGIQFNSDTGTNYAWRRSANTGADTTGTNTNQCQPRGATATSNGGGGLMVLDIINDASIRKMVRGTASYGVDLDDTNAPSHENFACKWDNTANQITTLTLMKVSGTSNYASSTQIVVWGHN